MAAVDVTEAPAIMNPKLDAHGFYSEFHGHQVHDLEVGTTCDMRHEHGIARPPLVTKTTYDTVPNSFCFALSCQGPATETERVE